MPSENIQTRGSFPWHCKKLFLTIMIILQKKYPELTHYFLMHISAYD
jgi:hypothetical protein